MALKQKLIDLIFFENKYTSCSSSISNYQDGHEPRSASIHRLLLHQDLPELVNLSSPRQQSLSVVRAEGLTTKKCGIN